MKDYPHAELTEQIIGAAIEVHRRLGPGLLESAYEACLSRELELRNIPHQRQVSLPIEYKGVFVEAGYRLDITADKRVIVELKSVDQITPVHEAQLLTYLKLSKTRIGLLINFNVALLKDGVKRLIV